MTASVPTLAAYDDVASFSLATWGNTIIIAAIRSEVGGGRLAYRFETDHKGVWRPIGSSHAAFFQPMRQLTVVAIGNELCMAWSNHSSGKVIFARMSLLTGEVSFSPLALVAGSTPALAAFQNTGLMMAYSTAQKSHHFITTDDLGESWRIPPVLSSLGNAGSGNITEIDVTNPFPQGANIMWTETDLPLAGE